MCDHTFTGSEFYDRAYADGKCDTNFLLEHMNHKCIYQECPVLREDEGYAKCDPLTWGAMNGYMDVIQFIGSNCKDNDQAKYNLALYCAIPLGHLDVVKYMHELGADLTANENYAIRTAGFCSHTKIIKYLHRAGADINLDNNYIVYIAAAKNNIALMKYLIQNKINLNLECISVAWISAQRGHLEMIKFYHENGIPITRALVPAVECNFIEIVKYIRENDPNLMVDKHVIGSAVSESNFEMFRYLHNNGYNTSECNINAMCVAAAKGNLEIIRYLHMRGVSILCRKNYPIRWASRNGHLEAVKFFKEKGAIISAQRNYAARHAAWGGHLEVLKYLHQNNADITAVNNFAIKVAIERKFLDIIKYFHDVGVDLTDPSFISKAVGEEDEVCLEIVTYLVVECGADVTVNNNETIRKVCKGECVKTAQYLIACGADITAKNNEAIYNAVDHNAIKMVEYLLSLNVYPTEMIRSIESHMDEIQNMLNTYTYFVMTKSAC